MSGALFVIGIPTEKEENKLRNDITKHETFLNNNQETEQRQISEGSSSINSSVINHFKTKDLLAYGTFSKDLSSKSISSNKSQNIGANNSTDKNEQSKPEIIPLDCRGQKQQEQNQNQSSYPLQQMKINIKDNIKDNIEMECPSLSVASDASMELVMIELLKKMKIDNAIWQKSKEETYFQIIFSLETNTDRYESIITLFHEWGIGERNGSFLSILPCSVYSSQPLNDTEDSIADTQAADDELLLAQKKSAWNGFLNSTRARLNVAQIVAEVKEDAQITFDFVTCLVVAGILAAFGLIENSTIFLASSMLISPLMGPIIATIFGTAIKDRELTIIGFFNEMIGILLATTVGFIFGLLVCSIDSAYTIGNGLSNEILSRCEFHSLLVGTFTALPSGAAVAIAILGENIGSLVGVAISASLLPPAVNAVMFSYYPYIYFQIILLLLIVKSFYFIQNTKGLVWALSILNMTHKNDVQYNNIVKKLYWSNDQAIELFILGSISMLLTIINVICIYAMGVLFLKIKEVAPIVSRNHRQFWKYDLKAARDFNKTCLNEKFDAAETERLIVAEQQLRAINHPSYQNTWSPMSSKYLLNNNFKRESRGSIHINMPTINNNNQLFQNYSKMSILGGRPGSYKTIIGKSWSPPIHKSLLTDQIFPELSYRRASMPHFNLTDISASTSSKNVVSSSNACGGASTNNNKLQMITEATQFQLNNFDNDISVKASSNSVETANESIENRFKDNLSIYKKSNSKRTKKFIVTPIHDVPK